MAPLDRRACVYMCALGGGERAGKILRGAIGRLKD